VGLNLARDFGFFSYMEAIQLAYIPSVVLLRSPLVPDIMWEGAAEVYLH
jgi:hypothetical protein